MKKNLSKSIGIIAIVGVIGATGSVMAFAERTKDIDKKISDKETIITDKEQLEQIIIDDNLEVPEGYELIEVIEG